MDSQKDSVQKAASKYKGSFLTWGSFYPLKIALQKFFFTPYFPPYLEFFTLII